MEPEAAIKLFADMFILTKRDTFDDKTIKLIYWLVYRLLRVVTGNRWKPMEKYTSPEENKRDFCTCISASDIGFSVYLLSYYNKHNKKEGNTLKKKARCSNKEYTSELDKYSVWCRDIKKNMNEMDDNNKKSLNIWILALIKKEKRIELGDKEEALDEEVEDGTGAIVPLFTDDGFFKSV
jgi:hypothetical protein